MIDVLNMLAGRERFTEAEVNAVVSQKEGVFFVDLEMIDDGFASRREIGECDVGLQLSRNDLDTQFKLVHDLTPFGIRPAFLAYLNES